MLPRTSKSEELPQDIFSSPLEVTKSSTYSSRLPLLEEVSFLTSTRTFSSDKLERVRPSDSASFRILMHLFLFASSIQLNICLIILLVYFFAKIGFFPPKKQMNVREDSGSYG
jgi:hypothetical protein